MTDAHLGRRAVIYVNLIAALPFQTPSPCSCPQSVDPSRNTGIPIALARLRMRAVRASEDAAPVTHKPVLARRDVAIAHSADSPVSKEGKPKANYPTTQQPSGHYKLT